MIFRTYTQPYIQPFISLNKCIEVTRHCSLIRTVIVAELTIQWKESMETGKSTDFKWATYKIELL